MLFFVSGSQGCVAIGGTLNPDVLEAPGLSDWEVREYSGIAANKRQPRLGRLMCPIIFQSTDSSRPQEFSGDQQWLRTSTTIEPADTKSPRRPSADGRLSQTVRFLSANNQSGVHASALVASDKITSDITGDGELTIHSKKSRKPSSRACHCSVLRVCV